MLQHITKSEVQKAINNNKNLVIEYQVIDAEWDYKRLIHFENIKIDRSITQLWIEGGLLYIHTPSRYKTITLAIDDDIKSITELKAA